MTKIPIHTILKKLNIDKLNLESPTGVKKFEDNINVLIKDAEKQENNKAK